MQYLRLADRVLLRKYGDRYFAYQAKNDELYELDFEAFNFLLSCDGSSKEIDGSSLDYLLSENLVDISSEKRINDFYEQKEPSLRFLLLTVTNLCNLTCEHCYVPQRNEFMSFGTFKKAVDDFYRIGGLKLIISGGEPLIHPEIFEFLKYARKYPFRVVLLTNGYLIRAENVPYLSKLVDEVQISLDGLTGHEKLRNAGWRKAVEKIEMLSGKVDVSISTMVTRYNVNEFEEMKRIVDDLNVVRWSIDVPTCETELLPDWEDVKRIMSSFGFGEMGHESISGYACGAHYCEVNPDGSVVKCGFFEESVGNIAEGLEECWERMKKRFIWKTDVLKCNCKYRDDCRGGCRYRALVYSGDLFLEDPVMCCLFGVLSRNVNSEDLNT